MVIKRTQDCLSLLERGTGVQQPKGALALGKLCTPRNSVALSGGHLLDSQLDTSLELGRFFVNGHGVAVALPVVHACSVQHHCS